MSTNTINLQTKLHQRLLPELSNIILEYIDKYLTLSIEEKKCLEYVYVDEDCCTYEIKELPFLISLKNSTHIQEFLYDIFRCSDYMYSTCLCTRTFGYNTSIVEINFFDRPLDTSMKHTKVILKELQSNFMQKIIFHMFNTKLSDIQPISEDDIEECPDEYITDDEKPSKKGYNICKWCMKGECGGTYEEGCYNYDEPGYTYNDKYIAYQIMEKIYDYFDNINQDNSDNE